MIQSMDSLYNKKNVRGNGMHITYADDNFVSYADATAVAYVKDN